MTARTILAAVLAAASAAACTGYAPDEPRYQAGIPAGSTLVLERALEVPPGARQVHVQDGRVLAPGAVSIGTRFRPRCSFAVDRGEPGAAYTIRPDRFRTGVMRRGVRAERAAPGRVQVASSSVAALRLAEREGPGGGPDTLTYSLDIPLSSERQPEVRRLSCRVDRQVGLPRRIGRDTVEQGLAGFARLEIAE